MENMKSSLMFYNLCNRRFKKWLNRKKKKVSIFTDTLRQYLHSSAITKQYLHAYEGWVTSLILPNTVTKSLFQINYFMKGKVIMP